MTRNCPLCGHANLLSADECLKCHTALSPEAHGESAADFPERSPLPWMIGGFIFIFVAGLAYTGQNRAASIARPAVVETVSEPPPEAPPEAPQAPPLIASASGPVPQVPGAPRSLRPEWRAVAQLQGKGHQRTRPFRIRSPHWRMRWAWSTTNQGDHDWYGPGSDFKAKIYRNEREQVAEAANAQGQYSGTSRVSGPGTFYAEIHATGNWTISVEEWW